ncbi:LPXTG cell wall anchor domain-containing protein [Enterococcus sp. 5H]|uniref:LPXTG cell wall anchor domain-containing protein n=1 Tax=Enterococcus sp. 5H TaxID=1229490 RepID=UPI0023048036|nr:LPXTG cell wall anchor domain-containing protein [Enterococcus sp. 5H]MDA9472504.1 hypothetical protein [Enterococcus sp. 5H]
MRTVKPIILFCFLLALFSLTLSPVIGYGTDGAGGQVNTGGKISFYEVETLPDELTPVVPGIQDLSTKKDNATVEKPVGNLPSTGELIRTFSFIGIGIVLLNLLIIVLRRRVKEGE